MSHTRKFSLNKVKNRNTAYFRFLNTTQKLVQVPYIKWQHFLYIQFQRVVMVWLALLAIENECLDLLEIAVVNLPNRIEIHFLFNNNGNKPKLNISL